MRKITFLFVLLLCNVFFISNLFSQEMTYTNLRDGNGITIGLSLKSYEISSLNQDGEAMNEIVLSGIFIPNEAGMPNLPRISRFVAIPQGAEVRVSVKSMETENLQNINIAPALRIQAIPEEPVMDYVKDQRRYATNEFYPQNPVEISEVISLRGVNAVMVGITPFQYNPVTKELIVINNIELEIEYVGGSKAYDDPKYRSPWFDPILKNALLNYEVLPDIAYTGKSHRDGDGCEYLIVIPNREDFRPYAEQIKEFRTKQGIYTKIMTLAEMGVTTTTQLKSYFHNAYNTWAIPPVAVLLMGDHNTNMTLGIPAEVIPHAYSGSCITDNQYADVTGDLLPEMVFGRMAAETEAQMAVLVSKFIEYETQPCMEPSYYQNPITALGWQTERWFQICSEAAGGYWRKQGKTPVRINAIYSGTPGNSWSSNPNTSSVVNVFGPNGTGYLPATPAELGGWSSGTAAHVVTAMNNGAFALQHRDHGFENGWGEPAFQTQHISQLNNVGKMTYLFTINCLTGKFNHSSPCFGEVFHRYTYQGQNAGCVGFLGPTEVSYSFVNDAYVWGMYDLYDPDFMPTYGYMGPHAAAYSGNWMPAFGNVSGKYFLAQSSWPYNPGDKNITYQMFTAHSDIFLRIFTEVPQEVSVNHPDVSLAGMSNFYIIAEEGALISLSTTIDDNLEILDVAVATGEMQIMNIPATLIPTTEINVVITGQNFLRYEAIVQVVPAEGPYVVPIGYTVPGGEILTYISTNSEIVVALKNVGVETANGPLLVTITSDDPELTINNATAQCGDIAPDGTATVNFNVTVANSIPDNKSFSASLTIVGNETWENKITLKAYAPKFTLSKVLVNGVENGNLEKGTMTTITAVLENNGGAGAFNVKADLEIDSEFVILACADEMIQFGKPLPAGETMEIDYVVIADPNMPYGHVADFNLLVNAQYERSFTAPFTAASGSSENYCSSGSQNCSSNDKFTSVILHKTSTPNDLLINQPNLGAICASGGYQDYKHIDIPLEPGQQYTIKIKVGYGSQYVRGWFDLNGNNNFDSNELLISFNSISGNVEHTQDFTIPADFVPGVSRFRLVAKWNSAPVACNNSSYGQTHDYTITLPQLYARVQNVNAVLFNVEEEITITWDAPEGETPVGYNIYRNKNKLNSTPLTTTTFTEENVEDGVYVYGVTAVYAGNKESFAEMSNIICNFTPPEFCDSPVNLSVSNQNNTAVLTWDVPVNIDGVLLNYNIFRNGTKIAETFPEVREYTDSGLEKGTYIYQISAAYGHCESEKTDEQSIIIFACETPVNLSATVEHNTIILTWNESVNMEGILLNYHIFRDGEQIGETLPEVREYTDTELEEGTYAYQVSAKYEHCVSAKTGEVLGTVLGINDYQTSTFDLYPNPTTGNVTFEGVGLSRIEIYDIRGRKLNEYDATDILQINVNHLNNGIYLVKMYSEANIAATKRLVIMR